MVNKVYETVVNYNIVKSNQTHYTNLIEKDDNLYSEIDFRIEIYNDFKLINKKYMDTHEVTVINNNNKLHGVTYNIYQNIRYLNNGEKQYLDLMKSILYKNNIKDSRNSRVISQFGEKMVFDLKRFPLLTTKEPLLKLFLENYFGLFAVQHQIKN